MLKLDSTVATLFPKQTFGRRELIPLETTSLWKIETGYVRGVTIDEDGTLATIGFWQPGDVIGQYLSCLDSFDIECLTPVEACVLPHDDLQCQANLFIYAHQMQSLLAILHHKRIETRLICFLNWLAKEFGHPTTRGCLINLRLTHQDIADAIGTTRVTITRLLNQFQQEGRLLWRRQRCILRNNSHKKSNSLLNLSA
jgi:CRP-like cAMP-binding protein